ncbi:hypothetical protein [Spiroplasma sp. DGKH1]|uniref:hypothetical protein n=1 Tax=Spiroplasma sp. DGKH1 TaxID=3050074 RepID=UPI0034C5C4BD
MKSTILDEFNESYRKFKHSYQFFTNHKPEFDNFLMRIKEITNYWEQYEKLVYEKKQNIPIIIDLILHYKNSAIINQKIKNFLINEIEINTLKKKFTDELKKFYNNSKLLHLIRQLEEQKNKVKKKKHLTYQFLQNSEVLLELKNSASNHLRYPLITNINDINKFNNDFNTFETQLQWLANNNIYNFYLMHRNKNYNLKFSEAIHKFHIIVLKSIAKKEPNFTKINKKSDNLNSPVLYAKFLLLLFLNNFMVNIWKENIVSLKKK